MAQRRPFSIGFGGGYYRRTRPSLAPQDFAHLASGHSVQAPESRDLAVRARGFASNLRHLSVGEFGRRMTIAAHKAFWVKPWAAMIPSGLSALRHAVVEIIKVRAEEKVRRPTTRTVVASVKNKLRSRISSVLEIVRNAMGAVVEGGQFDIAVAFGSYSGLPLPALALRTLAGSLIDSAVEAGDLLLCHLRKFKMRSSHAVHPPLMNGFGQGRRGVQAPWRLAYYSTESTWL